MKLTTILSVIGFAILTFATASPEAMPAPEANANPDALPSKDYEHAVKCAQKNPEVNAAISDFCSKGDITIPSKYAREGKTYGGIHVSIHGDCNPKQWVPPLYCQAQFHKMCARGGPAGGQFAKFGRNDCQKWRIKQVKYN